MSTVAEFYRKYMPIQLRNTIGELRTRSLKKECLERMRQGEWQADYKEECEYMLQKNKLLTFPYEWTEEYNQNDIEVCFDKDRKMPYIREDNNRLYFPSRYPPKYIQKYFNTLRIEQDPRSAHYYFDRKDTAIGNSVFCDVGGAEGYISLRVAPLVRKLIIFECDQDWIRALHATFEPWKEKTVIINKYASSHTGGKEIRIDDVVKDEKRVVLKLDVEGMEADALYGASRTLEQPDTKVFVCSYHKEEDEKELTELLLSYGFQIQKSKGYMFYGLGGEAGFRRGIVRGKVKIKQESVDSN